MSNKDENNELKTLSIEELRAYKGLSNLSDEEALNMIATLKQVSLITYKIINNYEY